MTECSYHLRCMKIVGAELSQSFPIQHRQAGWHDIGWQRAARPDRPGPPKLCAEAGCEAQQNALSLSRLRSRSSRAFSPSLDLPVCPLAPAFMSRYVPFSRASGSRLQMFSWQWRYNFTKDPEAPAHPGTEPEMEAAARLGRRALRRVAKEPGHFANCLSLRRPIPCEP